MTDKKRRGLGSLIPQMDWSAPSEPQTQPSPDQAQPQPTPAQPSEAPLALPLDALTSGPYQPREDYDPEKLRELADSIRSQGILQPIIVRRRGDAWQVLAGWRRWQAARLAGLAQVPVVVRECTDREALELAVVENLQREDIGALDAAAAFKILREEFSLTEEQIAERIGVSRESVANRLRLLQLPKEIQDALRNGVISEGHARALLVAPTDAMRLEVFRRLREKGFSVRQVERVVRSRLGQPPRRVSAASDPNLLEVQEALQRAFGTKVTIQPKGRGGVIIIKYFGDVDLERIRGVVGA